MSAPAKSGVMAAPTADRAVRSITPAPSVLLQKKCSCSGSSASSGECEACTKREEEKKPMLQRSPASPAPAPPSAPPSVNRTLQSPGHSLDPSTRSVMEPRFGRDFSGVRVHTGPQAAESARDVNANAYTVGNHIVFDHGKYDPGSESGQHLLAHELAHTVQQSGLQRSSDHISLGESSEYHRLEHEADTIADAVMSGAPAPVPASRPGQPLVSRAAKDDDKKKTAASTAPTADSGRNWKSVPKTSALGQLGVKQRAVGGPGVSADIQAFNMGTLDLPPEKGNVEKVWKDTSNRGALQAIIDTAGDVKAGLKQERPKTEQLRKIWLQKVKWEPADAETNWKKITTSKSTFEPTRAGTSSCQVDHILELQFGGNNVPENMQMLDGPENMQSGREIFQDLKQKASQIRSALKGDPVEPDDILLYFEDVKQASAICGPCCEAEKKAPALGTLGKGESVSGEKGIPYPIQAGGPGTNLYITDEYQKDLKKAMPIKDSDIPENKSASTIISGLLLDKLKRGKTAGSDIIDAVFDTGSNSRIPVSLKGESKVSLNVAKDGKLNLPKGRPNLKFHYPYLSDGEFTEIKFEEDGTLSGKGSIKPSVPFLPTLNVKFDKDSFALIAPLDAKKLKSPIPLAKITEGEIGLQLAPEFKPYGALAFELARGPKKFLDGRLDVTADPNGLVAKGKLNAYLPGVDKAEGDITYQNKEWTGGVHIEATQLQSKMKYVKSGSVDVGLSSKGVSAQGKVSLDIPGTEGIDVSLFYEGGRWLFRGSGKFKIPRLEEAAVSIEYDGTHIYGEGKAGFKLFGLTGSVKVKYWDEKFSGEGDIEVKKGRVTGKLHVKMSPEHKFSGSGDVSVQVTENLIASAGIEIDEHEKVRFKGSLIFPKPIHLFDPIKGDYTIFEIGVSIPIPGLSIPKIGGLNARIEGSLKAGYQIGPGEIRNVKAEAAFNPLEDKPDLDITLSGQLYIGVNGHITGSIRGGVEISIGIASVSGGLGISATAALVGHVQSNARIHYEKAKFVAEADFELLLKLILGLAICAWVHAEAGVWRLKVETTKVWKLASFKYDPGLQLGMRLKKPIRYASDEGFTFPSLDDIEWIKPNIDASDVLGRLFGAQDPPDSDSDGAAECG